MYSAIARAVGVDVDVDVDVDVAPSVEHPSPVAISGRLGRYLHSADPCYCRTAGINHPAITAVFASGQPDRLLDVVRRLGEPHPYPSAHPRAAIEVSRGKRR
jgi:hypothetical protein